MRALHPSLFGVAAIALGFFACSSGGETITVRPIFSSDTAVIDGEFYCHEEDTVACIGGVHHGCERLVEFLQAKTRDCAAEGLVCDPELECVTCRPELDRRCDGRTAQACNEDGTGWVDVQRCDINEGDTCNRGFCINMCELAEQDRSYVGCEFFAADLDNAAINELNDASRQQYAVVVSNPQEIAIKVTVQIDEAAVGQEPDPRQVASRLVAPGTLEVFELPRREVDGSSEEGLNDGTHTALTSNAYRISSTHPIIAYQFNPLENVGVFSNDASLLMPTSALTGNYTVVGWPQTIGDSDNPDQDFDSTTSDEDLRAFLTIIGGAEGTTLEVTMGPDVEEVVGAGPIPRLRAGQTLRQDIGAYDVLNLETQGFNADFTGTTIRANRPVTVFVGSEASDVPIFAGLQTRRCCADHLEEQLFPEETLGTRFIVARMPPRTTALNAALDGGRVAEVDEPEWVRVVATAEDPTQVQTTLPFPDDAFRLQQGEGVILEASQDFTIDADRPIAVLQALPSQGVVGIPPEYPGGDPAIIAVPPVAQYRQEYIFLTPDKYAFDFITISARASADILLDGSPLPDTCTRSPADGRMRGPDDPPPEEVIYRCQLSFPEVTAAPDVSILPGDQRDGVHTLLATEPIGVVVYGFDRFVSYAYAAGLNLQILN